MLPRNRCLALLALIATAACQPQQQQAAPGPAEDYLQSCASCHGRPDPDGGVTGLDPTGPTPDLTRLAAVSGGTYPAAQVRRIIDGRQQLRAHGSPMPVWGNHLSRERVTALADYIATIQR